MANWKAYAPNDRKSTCKWCGAKLRWQKEFYAKPGDYGDGYFCGLRCGYLYGCEMAKLHFGPAAAAEREAH